MYDTYFVQGVELDAGIFTVFLFSTNLDVTHRH